VRGFSERLRPLGYVAEAAQGRVSMKLRTPARGGTP